MYSLPWFFIHSLSSHWQDFFFSIYFYTKGNLFYENKKIIYCIIRNYCHFISYSFCKIKGIFPIKTAKYTDKDIEDLVLKGVENYNGHQSFSYDLVENSKGNTYTRRFFHKGQKEKNSSYCWYCSHSSTGFSVITTDKKDILSVQKIN